MLVQGLTLVREQARATSLNLEINNVEATFKPEDVGLAKSPYYFFSLYCRIL